MKTNLYWNISKALTKIFCGRMERNQKLLISWKTIFIWKVHFSLFGPTKEKYHLLPFKTVWLILPPQAFRWQEIIFNFLALAEAGENIQFMCFLLFAEFNSEIFPFVLWVRNIVVRNNKYDALGSDMLFFILLLYVLVYYFEKGRTFYRKEKFSHMRCISYIR